MDSSTEEFATIQLIQTNANPPDKKVRDAFGRRYHASPQYLIFHVDGEGIYLNQIKVWVDSVSYHEQRPGALLIIGAMLDEKTKTFHPVHVFYDADKHAGRMRIYKSVIEFEFVSRGNGKRPGPPIYTRQTTT